MSQQGNYTGKMIKVEYLLKLFFIDVWCEFQDLLKSKRLKEVEIENRRLKRKVAEYDELFNDIKFDNDNNIIVSEFTKAEIRFMQFRNKYSQVKSE